LGFGARCCVFMMLPRRSSGSAGMSRAESNSRTSPRGSNRGSLSKLFRPRRTSPVSFGAHGLLRDSSVDEAGALE
jgi:hypothetical protein